MVIHNQERVVARQTAELLDLGLEVVARALHRDEELADLVPVALERVAQPARLVLERDVVAVGRGHGAAVFQVVEGPGQDQDVDLGVLWSDRRSWSAGEASANGQPLMFHGERERERKTHRSLILCLYALSASIYLPRCAPASGICPPGGTMAIVPSSAPAAATTRWILLGPPSSPLTGSYSS